MSAAAGHGRVVYREEDCSLDDFLGGALTLLQPRDGYRAATDPVLLAAACAAQPGERVLDVGCGVGAAGLCLARRVPGVSVEGIELQPELAELSRINAARNGVGGWLAHAGDIRDAPLFVRSVAYDHVITNPPYFGAGVTRELPNTCKDLANRESASMAEWLDFCLRRLKPRGTLLLIQRIERLPEILALLSGRAGGIVALPLSPWSGRVAKRVIVRAVKECRTPFELAAPFVLHVGRPGDNAAPFSPDAEAVLRGGGAIAF